MFWPAEAQIWWPQATTITSETVWNELANNEGATGGGISDVFPLAQLAERGRRAAFRQS